MARSTKATAKRNSSANRDESKRAQTPKKKPANGRSTPIRLFRGLMGFVFLMALVLGVGSYIMRERVIALLRNRALESSSVLLSRAYPITPGVNINGAKVADRLNRLGYHPVTFQPEYAGQYRVNENSAELYLHEVELADGKLQREELVRLNLSPGGNVDRITDIKFGESVPLIYIEPEVISLLAESSTRASLPLRLEEFPKVLIEALLSIEDERFYLHFGIDPLAIFRALVVNARSGRVVQGASTITQQLAKNLFFSQERSIGRKLYEAFSALLIETAFTKDRILEFYMNEVFLGQEGNVAIHGFGEAARSFFGKEVSALTLAEAATLAGIIKAPTSYSPRKNPDRAAKRRKLVLDKMLERSKISMPEYESAVREKLKISPAQRNRRSAPYFVDYVRRELVPQLQVNPEKDQTIRIHTGLDPEYQQCAENAVAAGLEALEKQYSRLKKSSAPVESALIAVSPASGEILAWIGGRDYQANQFDRVSQAKRQPGSAFKPFVYLTALDKQLNDYRVARTTSLLSDAPISLDVPGTGLWQPTNYDNTYRGEVTLRQALTHSLNLPTIDLALKVGIDRVARTAELFGFGENLPRVPSLALGAGDVSPLDLARSYATIANGGLLIKLRPVTSVTEKGVTEPLFQSMPSEQRVASEPAVFVLTNILQSVIEQGTGNVVRRLGFKSPAAGKTGTTNDARDSWFAGFTPRLLAVVWVGFDDNRKLGLTGAQAAAPIWTEFMKCAAPMEPELDFVPPPGILYRQIDLASGLLWAPGCGVENRVTEVFVEGTEPISSCDERMVGQPQPASPDAPPREAEAARAEWEAKDRAQRAMGGWGKFWDRITGSH